jgi:putative DNA primase/helicase
MDSFSAHSTQSSLSEEYFMNRKVRNSTELKRQMEGHWLHAFSALANCLQNAIDNLGQNVPCPINGGTDGFRLFKDAAITGGGVKHAWRVIPEGIDMLMWVNNWSFTTAFDELEAWLDNRTVTKQPVTILKQKKVVDDTHLRAWLNKIWLEALPLNHLASYPARAYFGYRKILTASLNATDIRYHPCLTYKDKHKNVLGKFGAVLCLVRNNAGEPVQIHRTFISKGGLKVELGGDNKPKKMTPSVNKNAKGRQIRLFASQEGCIGIAEGLETALAIVQARQFPVWSCTSNTNLQGFIPPKGVHTVINFIDKDCKQAGEISAKILRERLQPRGIRVVDLLPPTPVLDEDTKGVDWWDQWVRDPSGFYLLDEVMEFSPRMSA